MLKLLFICTHNRCRSILCEALARHLGSDRIAAYSAGSQPSGAVHPETLQQLAQRGISTSGLCSESWDVYADLQPDAVITVCDSAAKEQCPLWLGQSVKVHWGLPDPSRIDTSDAARATAFNDVIEVIEGRLTHLLSMEFENLSGQMLHAALQRVVNKEL